MATATDADGNTSGFSGAATVAQPLIASGEPAGAGSNAATVKSHELGLVVDAAIEIWESIGLTGDTVEALRNVDVQISDLSGAYLGLGSPNSITIDVDAAGHGWFVGPATFYVNGTLTPNPGSAAGLKPIIEAARDTVDDAFSLNRQTGEIRVRDSAQLDFETTPSFPLQVRASNGSTEILDVTIDLIDAFSG